jgi:ADP-ribose pyrophosphatase YjhB (NUDIX family)
MAESSAELLRWARQLYSISQAGLTYCKNDYDLERYHQLQDLAAEILASRSTFSETDARHSFSMQAGYATPKIDVRGAVIQDGKILLIQEKADGKWALPGGWADIGDTPAQTVAREVWEESGFKVSVDKVIAIYDGNHIAPLEFYQSFKLIFRCSISDGQPQTSYETLAVGFFDLNDLPPLSLLRTNLAMLQEVFAHDQDPTRQTAFD